MNDEKIKCPKCGAGISIDEVMTRQIEANIKKDLEEAQKTREAEIAKQKDDLERQKQEIKSREENFNKNVSEKLEAEKIKIAQELKKRADEESRMKMNLLEERLKEKDEKLNEAQLKEIEIRKEKNRLEEDKKSFELEKQRQLDEERKKIADEAMVRATEANQYKIAQMQKQLSDAIKSKDDLARKLEQGSQQTQGEVVELELEDLLRKEFVSDEITPVPKGMNGADIIQKVLSRQGRLCGYIAWEVKKTKAWSEGWVQKLKDDQRAVKADLAVIVSAVLPSDVKGFAYRNGVWICDIKLAIALASALRINLEGVAREKFMAEGKNDKMEVLYSYLTGVEFKQRVEAIVEAFTGMQEGLNKERRAFEKIWSEREKQIQKAFSGTVGMYGDLSGLVSMPQIKTLELPGEEEGEQEGMV